MKRPEDALADPTANSTLKTTKLPIQAKKTFDRSYKTIHFNTQCVSDITFNCFYADPTDSNEQ